MKSIFEEKKQFSPVIGGFKDASDDSDLLQKKLTSPSLLEEPSFESQAFLKNQQGELQKIYLCVTNEVLYTVIGPENKTILQWMDLRFRRMEAIQEKGYFGYAVYGDNTKYEFFFQNEKLKKKWHQFLAEYCLQLHVLSMYTKEQQVGKGNYATVFLGTEIATNEAVAIKSVSKEMLRETDRNVQAMIDEIDSMRSLRHPNLCGLFGIFEDEECVHLVMEFCNGGELFKRIIKRKKYSENNAARFAQNCLSALAYLHEVAFVCHRDLKLENLMLISHENDFDFQIVDFGLACKFDPINPQMKIRCGSPGYVGPEVLTQKSYGPKCDIFSLGIIMYILMVGKQPFYGKNPQEILMQNKQCKIKFKRKHWENLTQDALDFVIQLTDPNPKTRPSARQALQHKWFKTMKTSPESVYLAPANEIKTPSVLKIEPISPGLTGSQKQIARDKLVKQNYLTIPGKTSEGVWSNACLSPMPQLAQPSPKSAGVEEEQKRFVFSNDRKNSQGKYEPLTDTSLHSEKSSSQQNSQARKSQELKITEVNKLSKELSSNSSQSPSTPQNSNKQSNSPLLSKSEQKSGQKKESLRTKPDKTSIKIIEPASKGHPKIEIPGQSSEPKSFKDNAKELRTSKSKENVFQEEGIGFPNVQDSEFQRASSMMTPQGSKKVQDFSSSITPTQDKKQFKLVEPASKKSGVKVFVKTNEKA